MSTRPYIITKFGGKSVSFLECWQTIAKITQTHLQQGLRPVIVCSAVSGITDLLEQLFIAAIQKQQDPVLKKIYERHEKLSNELQVPLTGLAHEFTELAALAAELTLIKKASPHMHAQILAFGERLSTRLGAAFLQQQNINIAWYDSRDLLVSINTPNENDQSRYLSARCACDTDASLIKKLTQEPAQVIITQGFVASNPQGETVVLGRGGSDTSAAYFAAKLNAVKCEIWTDVPGIYSANPHQVPEAQLLHALDYDEAQEIALMGAKVLHPRTLLPVKYHNIPLYIGNTFDPTHPGTLISNAATTEHQIKAILTRYGLSLISIETLDMWQQVGFLADVFAAFKRHGLSIDLVSTSETNVTVSLDLKATAQDQSIVAALLKDLNTFCKATMIGPCASISLVGRNIRAIFHKLGHAFTVFEEQHIHLISQAANDLNLTFVVDEDQAERLVLQLHHLLFDEVNLQKPLDFKKRWWFTKQKQLLTLAKQETPRYVYDAETLRNSVNKLKNLTAIDKVFYAVKANDNSDILKQFYAEGLGFECVSLNELTFIFSLFKDIDPARIIFTPNFAPKQEYAEALKLGVNITIDNLYPLEHWSELFKGKKIIARIDPGQGYGHHRHVCTAGNISKFGIPMTQFEQLKTLTQQHNIEVVGLHAHTGSGILSPEVWQQTALFLTNLIQHFPKIKYINIGGGLGIPEKPQQHDLDLTAFDNLLTEVKSKFPKIEFWLEPGRFLVAQAGVLLARVTQIKTKDNITFIGIDTGMNSLIRPALYGSYHFVSNLSRLDEPATITANIVGPICESGDTLAFSRQLPETFEGDIILIDNTGAYGHVMSSNYNMRVPAKEIYI